MEELEYRNFAERLSKLVIEHGQELIRKYGKTPAQILADGGFRVNVRDFRNMIVDYDLSDEVAFTRSMDWMYHRAA